MSDVRVELTRALRAYEQPTLRLLNQQQAAATIAMLRSAFGDISQAVPVGRMHAAVDVAYADLRAAGIPDVPAGTGREVCRRWVTNKILIDTEDEGGEQIYRLTRHAQEGLELIRGLTGDRPALSEHRIANIVRQARTFNAEINPDRSQRIAILDERITEATRERDRLAAGGEISPASADYLRDGFGVLMDQLAALPQDFSRVEEVYTQMRANILAEFNAEARPAGDIIGVYLQRVEALGRTSEGEAFAGALALLRDAEILGTLREDIAALLNHPMALEVLPAAEVAALRDAVPRIRQLMARVTSRRARVTRVLRDYIVTHDAAAERELDSVMHALTGTLPGWLARTGPRTTVPLELLPAVVDVATLQTRFDVDPPEDGIEPLPDPSEGREQAALGGVGGGGGPRLDQLRVALDAALSSAAAGTGPQTLGELFATLPVALRRPVEILGLAQLARQSPHVARAQGPAELYRTVRADGSTRDLLFPPFLLRPAPDLGSTDPTATGPTTYEDRSAAYLDQLPAADAAPDLAGDPS